MLIALNHQTAPSFHRRPQPLPRAELAGGVAGLRWLETRHSGGEDQDARLGARVAPAARGSTADVEAAKAVEADDAALGFPYIETLMRYLLD